MRMPFAEHQQNGMFNSAMQEVWGFRKERGSPCPACPQLQVVPGTGLHPRRDPPDLCRGRPPLHPRTARNHSPRPPRGTPAEVVPLPPPATLNPLKSIPAPARPQCHPPLYCIRVAAHPKQLLCDRRIFVVHFLSSLPRLIVSWMPFFSNIFARCLWNFDPAETSEA